VVVYFWVLFWLLIVWLLTKHLHIFWRPKCISNLNQKENANMPDVMKGSDYVGNGSTWSNSTEIARFFVQKDVKDLTWKKPLWMPPMARMRTLYRRLFCPANMTGKLLSRKITMDTVTAWNREQHGKAMEELLWTMVNLFMRSYFLSEELRACNDL
jgi:hypothetical protein